jgi:hypothetical protein
MKHITQVIAISVALIVAGCATSNLPRSAQAVGWGQKISWRPQESESGTAILVEKTTGKKVMTKKLFRYDPVFRFDVSAPDDKQVLMAVFGGSAPSNAEYVLYFVPGHE